VSKSPLDQLDLIEVERAAVDLRRGLPVVVGGERPILVLTAETAVADTWQQVCAWLPEAAPLIGLTLERAETLKIRPYTSGAIAVPAGDEPLKQAAILADPSEDLIHAMGGPYNALRSLEGRPLAAAIKLAKIGGLLPSVLALDLPEGADHAAFAVSKRITVVNQAEVAKYDLGITEGLRIVSRAKVPLDQAPETTLAVFRSDGGGPEHYAIIIGDLNLNAPVLARIHSECFTGDLIGSLKCDCGEQLRGAIGEIAALGSGVLLYLAQEGRGIGLPNKIRAYRLQDQGFDTVDANTRLGFEVDERFFGPAAKMLELLGVTSVRLMTNNPDKVSALEALGVSVSERVEHKFQSNAHNEHYLLTKRDKTGHLL